jgi:hypothetical protein
MGTGIIDDGKLKDKPWSEVEEFTV